MYMKLCPDGAEGSSYAMLTTFGNIALVCGSNIGNALAGIWYGHHLWMFFFSLHALGYIGMCRTMP